MYTLFFVFSLCFIVHTSACSKNYLYENFFYFLTQANQTLTTDFYKLKDFSLKSVFSMDFQFLSDILASFSGNLFL